MNSEKITLEINEFSADKIKVDEILPNTKQKVTINNLTSQSIQINNSAVLTKTDIPYKFQIVDTAPGPNDYEVNTIYLITSG